MRIQTTFNQLANKPTLFNTIANAEQKSALDLMCCRIGIVQKFYPDDLTVDVLIVNKKTMGLNSDGSQVVQDWAKINAKICYCNPFETFPIKEGDECLLFFSDREIESWFINGNTNPLAHSRMHDETDCIAVLGLRSLPKMIQIATDCLHLFYGDSNIQIKSDEIVENSTTISLTATNLNISADSTIIGNVTQTGNTVQTGDIIATNLGATSAASGTFQSQDGKTVFVVDGIIKAIT